MQSSHNPEGPAPSNDHFSRPSMKRTALTNQDMQAFFTKEGQNDSSDE